MPYSKLISDIKFSFVNRFSLLASKIMIFGIQIEKRGSKSKRIKISKFVCLNPKERIIDDNDDK